MKSFIVLVLFIGIFLIVNGVYEQKLLAATSKKQIEYRFVPRTFYDEQIEPDLMNKVSGMFKDQGVEQDWR